MTDRKSVTPAVAEYLHQNADRRVGASELMEALQLTKTQVSNAIQRSIREEASWVRGLEVVIKGNAWVYHSGVNTTPSKAPCKRLFEELAVTKAGSIIVQDEEGALYRLIEVE